MNEEMLMKAQTLQRESEQIENNILIINEHILELNKFNENLMFLENKEEEKEILTSLGRGVYVKSKILDEKKLFVEIGAGIVVKKSPTETKKVIEDQIEKFEDAKKQLLGQLHMYKEEFGKMLKEVKKMKKLSDD